MKIGKLDDRLSVTPQITADDVREAAAAGFRAIICNRPDGEGADQPTFAEIEAAAAAAGMKAAYLPVTSGMVRDEEAEAFGRLTVELPGPILAYCRSGTRSATLWSLAEAGRGRPAAAILARSKAAGFDLTGVARRVANRGRPSEGPADAHHRVVIVGAGAAGIAVASSLKARDPGLDIAIVDPSDVHYYQPGWTLVGGGVFSAPSTARTVASLIPRGVRWIKAAVAAFDPDRKTVILEGCRTLTYDALVVATGLKLDWTAIEGLDETLGRNGVTSNYRYDLAPYTWELVSNFRGGKAVFTQPPMPIKCAGAPQKALYLSADDWRRRGVLKDVSIDFYNAGAVLFGVKEYVPALMEYIERYHVDLHFQHRLVAVDGRRKTATFEATDAAGAKERVTVDFDILHAVPPQVAPDVVRASPLADAAGWVAVDQATLRHATLPGVYALGDVANAPNAKTAAAARKQAPVVAHNLLKDLTGAAGADAVYDGYGSCPLTVERGKIVLAEFGYGGKLLPSFPAWMIDGKRPTRLAWLLKERILPGIYWKAMLRGREWMARPELPG